jgi:hypothetical protein
MVAFQGVVPANAGTHTTRTLVSALEQRPFFTFEARGDGSLRSQGRPLIVRGHDRISARRSWSYAIALMKSRGWA